MYSSNINIVAFTVTNPEHATQLLKDRTLVPPQINNLIAFSEHNWALNLEHLKRLSKTTPIFLSGEELKKCRSAIAKFYASHADRIKIHVEQAMSSICETMKGSKEIEVSSDIAWPLTAAMIEAVFGEAPPRHLHSTRLSEIFNFEQNTPSKLKALNHDAQMIYEFAEQSSLGSCDLDCAITLLVFGIDSLRSTLMVNIDHMLNNKNHATARPLIFENYPITTGVPFTYRLLERDVMLDGLRLASGSIVKIMLEQHSMYSGSKDHNLMFGSGLHSCLGKNLSLTVWPILANRINELNITAFIKHIDCSTYQFATNYKALILEIARD